MDLTEAYQRRGDAPLQQLRAALEQEALSASAAKQAGASPTQPEKDTVTAAAAEPDGEQRSTHSVADVAALRSALGGVVWTASMRRM